MLPSDTCCHKARESTYSFVMSWHTILFPLGVAVGPRTVRTFLKTLMYFETFPSRPRDGRVPPVSKNARKCARTRTLRPRYYQFGTLRGRVGRSEKGSFRGTIVKGVTHRTPMGQPKSLAHPCTVSTRFPFRGAHGGRRVHSVCRRLLSVVIPFFGFALLLYRPSVGGARLASSFKPSVISPCTVHGTA